MGSVLLLMYQGLLATQPENDSAKVLREVEVKARLRRVQTMSAAPLQMLDKQQIANLNALQLSDAVKFFSGVTVKDYGGIGGLKTLSVRSLGANHTAVSYDGIRINDSQTGQIDIGRFSLENASVISLSNGQSDDIFQPAQLFAAGASLHIRTLKPVFEEGKRMQGKAGFKGGSFGLMNPSANIGIKFNENWKLAASGEWLQAHGRYPYLLHYGFEGIDSVSQEIRRNTDVRNIRLETSLFGTLSATSDAEVSIYYYHSERGLPGATIYYNTQNFSSQRLRDYTFFTRGRYTKNFSEQWSVQANLRYNRGGLRYVDPAYLNREGKEESNYLQQEYYASLIAGFRPSEGLSFSASSDVAESHLEADLPEFAYPSRLSWLSALAAKYESNRFSLITNVLATWIDERVQTGIAGKNYRKLSPYAGATLQPFEGIDLRFRTFYKHIFRMPSFNDLYYSRIGNPNLIPEQTHQFNVGATYLLTFGQWLPELSLTADAYHNKVKDKIVAYPTKNIFVWTMLNYGKVEVNGVDISASASFVPWDRVKLTLSYNHSYQQALNMTDPLADDYRHQIPYTPRVSGSGRVGLETPWGRLSYTMLWSGKRYAGRQNYAENKLEGYMEHNMSLAREFLFRGGAALNATVEWLNMTNAHYAVVRFFPMPGQSWRASINYKF